MKDVQLHFSEVANKYEDMRTKDMQPLKCIAEHLNGQQMYNVADIGAGCGRYSFDLFNLLNGDLNHFYCVDCNEDMLKQLYNQSPYKRSRLLQVKAFAEDLPFVSNYLDCMVTFNAIQHFNLLGFFNEVERVLKNDKYLFIYTRLRDQNKKCIWGQFFPSFYEKESRLYEIGQIDDVLRKTNSLQFKSMKVFKFERHFTLAGLVEQAMNHHYSTFCLYDEKEFMQCLDDFEWNISQYFSDLNNIVWDDEYSMIIIKKGE